MNLAMQICECYLSNWAVLILSILVNCFLVFQANKITMGSSQSPQMSLFPHGKKNRTSYSAC